MKKLTSVLVFLTIGTAGSANADVIEQVVAVVNDEAIFLSELRRRAQPFFAQALQGANPLQQRERLAQLYQEVRERLIDEQLFEQAAQKMQVRVSSADVQRAVSNVIQQNQLTEDEFWQAVRQQGYSESQYRSDVRRQLLRLKVLNQRVRGRVNITEEDVRRRYDQRLRQANRALRFHASHVFLAIPAGAGATDILEVRRRADEVRAELTPENFEEATLSYGGGDLGWLGQRELPEELMQPLQTMSPGEISQPIRGAQGFHIFLLHDRERGGASLPEYDDVKEQLYRQMVEGAMERSERSFLQELRREAIIVRRGLGSDDELSQ